MPTYEYQCQQCGERLEVFQKFTDKPLKVHPSCGGTLQKVFHPSGVVFKGSGYYVTDSRASKGNGASKAKSDNGSKKADSKGESSSSKSDKSSDKASKASDTTAAAD